MPDNTSTELALAVRPKTAWRMLNCGHDFGYKLLERRELDSYTDGAARWITTESIRAYIARRLAKSEKVRKSPRKNTAAKTPAHSRGQAINRS